MVQIKTFDDVEVAFLPKNRETMERCTTIRKMVTRSTNRLSDGSYLKQCKEIIAAEHPAATDVITNMMEKANKVLEDTALSLEVEPGLLLHSSFHD